MKQKLAVFEAEGHEYPYEIYGVYEICEVKGPDKKICPTLEFEQLVAKQVREGDNVPYVPDGHSWSGHKYDEMDMICGLLTDMTVGGTVYKPIYLEEGLQKVVDFYTNDASLQVQGKPVSSMILYAGTDVYELLLATDEYLYYGRDDEFRMYTTLGRELVADNYFAEVGFDDSLENIKNGSETLLFGELPEEEEQSIEGIEMETTEHKDKTQVFIERKRRGR